MCGMWAGYGILSFALHIFSGQVKIVENNIADFFGLFAKLRSPKAENGGKLKILIFNWRDIKHIWAGGAEVYIHELSKRWVKEGHNVTVFCGNVGKLPKNEIIDGIQIYRRGGFYMVYVWAILYYVFKFRGKYDVIIDSENGIPFFTPFYTKTKKYLLIHHVHQEVFRKSLKWPFSTIALFLEARLMPLVYRNVQVITVSPSSRDEIMRHKLTKKEPIIIYNGVDLEIFKPGKKSEKPTILYLGRLQYYKSLHVFIVVAKKILENIPDAEFIIAGEGGEKEKLQRFAEKIGIFSKIQFAGKVNEEEKVSLFQKAWVFVNPSFMEGWGITTIEAAACGTPTVASDVPGLRDSIKDPYTGILVPYGKYDRFARNIIKLIKDEKLLKKMSKESIEWSSSFNWDKSASKLIELISKEDTEREKPATNRNFSYLISRVISMFF
jgi:glycosyltransferase involved in cell wall biosynthesis